MHINTIFLLLFGCRRQSVQRSSRGSSSSRTVAFMAHSRTFTSNSSGSKQGGTAVAGQEAPNLGEAERGKMGQSLMWTTRRST